MTVSTQGFTLDKYKMVETGVDTGVFTGEVTLTGFSHDADGNKITGNADGSDTSPKTSGDGSTNEFIQTTNNDRVLISFTFSEDETVVGSALILWNEGQVRWLETSYPASGTGVVRVIDSDMNLNPDRIDNFDINVWSDSDAEGIDLTVTETNDSTGIFEGTIFFTTTDESSGHRLRVIEGDTLTAEYEDNTLPEPYTPADKQNITAISMIQELPMSPLKQQMSGVLPDDVKCKKELEKVFRYDGSAACVSPLTAEKLDYRGWTS